MKCYVHVGIDPFPKPAKGPSEAIALAEQYLQNNSEDFSIYWRRDDLYPNNLVEYSRKELLEEIQREGELTLQLAKVGNDLPILGEVVTIFSSEEEERNIREAEEALYRIDD